MNQVITKNNGLALRIPANTDSQKMFRVAVLIFTFLALQAMFGIARACTISVSAATSTICTGGSVSFTGTITSATGATTYQWRKNGVNMTGTGNSGSIVTPGNGSFSFSATGFSNGDVVTCYVTQSSVSFTGTSTGITITVNSIPAAITGIGNVGTGGCITLSDVTSGGTWSSSRTTIETVGSANGIVHGVAIGTSSITYSVSGCVATATVPDVTVAAVTGNTTICAGFTTSLADATTGGTWCSSNTAVASVSSATGVVTGVAAGTSTISYKVYGATVTSVITVRSQPSVIGGPSQVGVGGVIDLTNTVLGGSWTSNKTTVATVCVTCGAVTGVAAGSAVISYTLNTCYTATNISVISVAAVAASVTTVCAGSSVAYTDATAGGTWSTANAFIATVGSTGVVTGVAAGTTLITYKLYGENVLKQITVKATPVAISGSLSVGVGGSVILTDGLSGGTWSSSHPTVATVGSVSGALTGVSTGSSLITYTVNGCSATSAASVSADAAISGSSSICEGYGVYFTDAAAGGIWSSSNNSVATVGSSTGIVTGATAGTITLSYKLGTTTETMVVSVTGLPTGGLISGLATVAVGNNITLSDAVSGGSWMSANSLVATITEWGSGVVTGVENGTTDIIYTVGNACGSVHDTAVITITTTSGSGSGSGTTCTPTIWTLAGNGTSGYSGNSGAATAAQLSNPYGVACDASGNVYIADKGNNCIRVVRASGDIYTFAGNTTSGFSGDGSAATSAELNNPSGVACDASGNVYIADQGNNRVRKVNTSGIISTCAGNGTAGYTGDGSAATAAELNVPSNLATDNSGNLYIVDFNNSAIRKVTTAGIISTFAGTGTPGFSGDGGAATAAKLYHPTTVACDYSGDVIIDDENNDRIREVNASGIIFTIAGTGTDGYTGDGGPATAAELNEVYGVCTDHCGNVYIADQVNERIRIITPSGYIYTYCGTGVRGALGDGGAATAAQLYNPYSICTDASGNMYIADNINQKIRKVTGCGCSAGVSAVSGAMPVCSGSNITLTDSTSGGAWSSNDTAIATVNAATGVVTGVSAGTVTITYTLGTSATVTLLVRPIPSVAGTITNPTCSGYSNGSIELSVTGGSTTGSWLYYNYTWSNGGTSGGAWGLSAGTYSVIATDPNGCSGTASFTVAQPASLTGSAIVTDASVYGATDGSIFYTATGGTGSYTYEWSDGSSNQSDSSLSAGAYWVLTTDENGCSYTGYYTVNQPGCGRHASPNADTTTTGSQAQVATIINADNVNVYPNPFATVTNINFTLAQDSHVTVDVFNAINGEKVATLLDADATAGTTNNCVLNGDNLAAGVYIYRIAAGSDSFTGKVVLSK